MKVLFEYGIVGVVLAFFMFGIGFYTWLLWKRLFGRGKENPGLLGDLAEWMKTWVSTSIETQKDTRELSKRIGHLLENHVEDAREMKYLSQKNFGDIKEHLNNRDEAAITALNILRQCLKADHPDLEEELNGEFEKVKSILVRNNQSCS
jgi:hypothetical protein